MRCEACGQPVPVSPTRDLSASAAAELWGVSAATVRRWCGAGKVDADLSGGVWIVRAGAVPPYAKVDA